MMGDQSQSKREDVEHIKDFLLADLDGNGEVGTVELVGQAAGRAIRLAIPERGIADARQLVRHRAGRLVVIGALLHRQPDVYKRQSSRRKTSLWEYRECATKRSNCCTSA